MSMQRTEVDGVGVRYVDMGKQNGVPLVFIHGLACDSSFWRFQFPAFEADYRVLALDLPGFGQSDKPRDKVYSLDFFARAVRAVLEAACPHGSHEAARPVLIGHSMGYPILRRYLIMYPGQVRAVCNVDGFYFRRAIQAKVYDAWKEATKLLRWRMLGEDPLKTGEKFIEYTFYGKTPEAVREEVRAKTGRTDPLIGFSAWREMMRPSKWVKWTFPIPALAIYSRGAHTLADQEFYLRSVFPNLIYQEWNDTGHYPMLEKAERFNATLRDFLLDAGIGGC